MLATAMPFLGGFLGVLAVALIACHAAPRNTLPSPEAAEATNNIALQILRLAPLPQEERVEAEARLQEIMARLGAAVAAQASHRPAKWSRQHALRVLQTLDAALIDLRFVYPDNGAVDQFDEALTPQALTETNRLKLAAHPANARRQRSLRPGTTNAVYIADCDTTAFLYLGIAYQWRLPLRMVLIPSKNRRPGHVFIRWREGDRYLNWETLFGRESTDIEYTKEWHIEKAAIAQGSAMQDLTETQVLGWAWYLRAVRLERRGQIAEALDALNQALDLFPECLDAQRQFAWLAATTPGLSEQTTLAALKHAEDVLRVLPEDPDALDTLAACQAALGQFEAAVRTESLAVQHPQAKPAARAQYGERLKLYRRSLPFHPDRTRHKTLESQSLGAPRDWTPQDAYGAFRRVLALTGPRLRPLHPGVC